MCAHSTNSDNSVREKMYFFLTLHTVFTPEVQKEDEERSVNVSSEIQHECQLGCLVLRR